MEKHIPTMFDHWVKLLLVCFLVALLGQVHAGPEITILESSVEKGAVCLDGSPAAYYYDEGVGEDANNWIVLLPGGAWCVNELDCHVRANGYYGSSHYLPRWSETFQGITSSNQTQNPGFYKWTKAHIAYCDGASFAADVEEVNPKYNLHFRGERIFKVVVEELLAKGMKNADNIILAGQSAGGLAVMLHCDEFRALVPPNVKRVKCLADDGFFIQGKDIPGATEQTIAEPFPNVVELHGLEKFLPKSCTSKMDAKSCLHPENFVGDIQTPIFIMNSAFDFYQIQKKVNAGPSGLGNCSVNADLCTPEQIELMRGFRTSLINALPKGDCSMKLGMFIDSYNTHGHNAYDNTRWVGGPKETRLNNKTVGDAFYDWYFDRSCFREIDSRDTPQNFVM